MTKEPSTHFVAYLDDFTEKREVQSLNLSGLQFRMHYRILTKLEKAGATSIEKAVTVEEADLDLHEQAWLNYFAGAFLEAIKKTKDQRYYI